MAVWNSDFLNDPESGDFGAVSCDAILTLKVLFKQMFLIEHTWDPTVTPVMKHRVGECSIVSILSGIPISTGILGAIQFDSTSKRLYWDSSSVMIGPVNGIDHSGLIGLGDDDHTQYLLLAGREGIAPKYSTFVNVDILDGGVENLDTASAHYTQDYHVMPKVVHIGNDPTTGSLHDNNSIVSLPVPSVDEELKSAKLDSTLATIVDQDMSGSTYLMIDFGLDCFMPSAAGSSSGNYLKTIPYITASIVGISDWNGRLGLKNTTAVTKHIKLVSRKMA
jgi:hypothetical protein